MSKRKVIAVVVREGTKRRKGRYIGKALGGPNWQRSQLDANRFLTVAGAEGYARDHGGRVVRIVAKERPLLPISHEDEAIVDRLVAANTPKGTPMRRLGPKEIDVQVVSLDEGHAQLKVNGYGVATWHRADAREYADEAARVLRTALDECQVVCTSCARCGALPITELCFRCTQIVGIKDRITQARAEERERCARECDAEAKAWREAEGKNEGYLAASYCAEAIRALGEGVSPEVAKVLYPDEDTTE